MSFIAVLANRQLPIQIQAISAISVITVEPVQQLIAHNHEYISEFAQVCQLFMFINPGGILSTSFSPSWRSTEKYSLYLASFVSPGPQTSSAWELLILRVPSRSVVIVRVVQESDLSPRGCSESRLCN